VGPAADTWVLSMARTSAASTASDRGRTDDGWPFSAAATTVTAAYAAPQGPISRLIPAQL
jgi:hypothetical protein